MIRAKYNGIDTAESSPRSVPPGCAQHPASLTDESFSFSMVFAYGNLRGVLDSKAAIALQHGVVGTANFVEPGHGRCSFRLGYRKFEGSRTQHRHMTNASAMSCLAYRFQS
jgi:hypothetical protein